MHVPAHILHQAMELYLQNAYPGGVPSAVLEHIAPLQDVPDSQEIPLDLLERSVANTHESFALRLGQPIYPHMKLVIDPVPDSTKGPDSCNGQGFLLRVDVHDMHLHAKPSSPDAAWLASLRASNKELSERIESKWAEAGLPTFKEYLRGQLQTRRRAGGNTH